MADDGNGDDAGYGAHHHTASSGQGAIHARPSDPLPEAIATTDMSAIAMTTTTTPPPPSGAHDHDKSLTIGLFPRSWRDGPLSLRDTVHSRARPPGYMLVGQRVTPRSRRDMQLEELLRFEKLGLSPAPALFFGRGFAIEPRSIRLRALQRDPTTAADTAPDGVISTTATSAPADAGPHVEDEAVEGEEDADTVASRDGDDTGMADGQQESTHPTEDQDPEPDAGLVHEDGNVDGDATTSATPVMVAPIAMPSVGQLDQDDRAAVSGLSGWKGTALDPSASSAGDAGNDM